MSKEEKRRFPMIGDRHDKSSEKKWPPEGGHSMILLPEPLTGWTAGSAAG